MMPLASLLKVLLVATCRSSIKLIAANDDCRDSRFEFEVISLSSLATLFFWVNDLSLNENIKFAFAINLAFWLILTAWFYFRTDFLRLARNSISLLLLLAFVAIGVKLHLESNSRTGVVLAKTVSVKSGLDASNITLFELHEGALVNITDERQGWIEVQLDSKQKGWIPKDTLGL